MANDGLAEQFRDMMKSDDSVAIKAAELLVTKDKSLSMKTEVNDALRLAIFQGIVDHLKKRMMIKSAEFLSKISENYQIFMVSNKRKSRGEIVEFVKGIIEAKKPLSERLTERR